MLQVIQNHTKPVPEKLGILIDRFNLLPPKLNLPALTVKSADAHNWDFPGSNIPSDQWTNEARKSLHKCLEELPEDFQNYIYGDAKSEAYPYSESADAGINIREIYNPPLIEVVARYEDYKRLRKQFRRLVKFAFKYSSWLKQFEKSKRGKPTKQIVFMTKRFEEKKFANENYPIPIPSSTLFEISENGGLKTKFDEFAEAIAEHDVRRIRKCQVCKYIFWAGRVDKFCCSKKCNLVFNTRLNRVANKTEQQRKEDNRAKSDNRKHKSEKELRMLKNAGNMKP